MIKFKNKLGLSNTLKFRVLNILYIFFIIIFGENIRNYIHMNFDKKIQFGYSVKQL